jgi:hypothetical protein
MTKEKHGRRGNKEVKKPKQNKEKVATNAGALASKPGAEISGKKFK